MKTSDQAIQWLANGERGTSSESIFTHLTGIKASSDRHENDHPRDPADLRRCRLLLEQVPELGSVFYKMGGVSKQWALLVRDWPKICFEMDNEYPEWRNPRGAFAPKTNQLIKQAIGR